MCVRARKPLGDSNRLTASQENESQRVRQKIFHCTFLFLILFFVLSHSVLPCNEFENNNDSVGLCEAANYYIQVLRQNHVWMLFRMRVHMRVCMCVHCYCFIVPLTAILNTSLNVISGTTSRRQKI